MSAVWDEVAEAQAVTGGEARPGTLYGAERVESWDQVWWADTPAAADALAEAGYPQTVALVPDGKRDLFRPLGALDEEIQGLKRVVLAGADGKQLDELARRLGRHKCWRVRWPADAPNAAALAEKHGTGALRALVEAAEPYPIDGIHKPSAQAMLDYRNAPPPLVLTTGCSETDKAFRLPGEGKIILITGVPNHGKTTYLNHLMAHCAEKHGRKFAIFSPESGEWQAHASQLITWRTGARFRGADAISDDTLAQASIWLAAHFTFHTCDAEEEAPTLEWLLDRWRICILRDGATDGVLDPWNELDHEIRGSENESAYINRALQRLRAFGNRHGFNIWIIAHPTKLRGAKPGDPVPVPTPYDIAGGAAWNNKGDLILAVHTPDTETEIHVQKARFSRWGRRGRVAKLVLDTVTQRYRSADNAVTYDGPDR